MKRLLKIIGAILLGLGLTCDHSLAQTDGMVKLEATISDFGNGPDHWTVVWVTTESGSFIKTLRKQGPSWTTTHWNSHCSTWWNAKGGAAGSTAIDGYSSATATTYSGTNSPVILTWNCRDASNTLMTNGNYKLWLQYAEDCGSVCQGPVTSSGLLWTKGPNAATNTYANAGTITSIKVTWMPIAPPTVAPVITSAAPPGIGTVGVPYDHACTATGTAPIRFYATNLPTGLSMNSDGVISGIPLVGGTFSGSITATNGTLPNDTQAFSINIGVTPVKVAAALDGNNLVLSGTGPTNGSYLIFGATNASLPIAQWTPITSNTFDNSGGFGFTNAIDPGAPQMFHRVRVP